MTGISLYDTLAGEVRPLTLREEGKVALYACGPTVYDHPHLGHARAALTYDVLRRYLEWRGLDVRHVANITDIDDKIINRARDTGRTESEVAAEWERVYIDAMAALGVLDPHDRPRATEWVAEMVDFVGRIMDAGAAYTTPTGVYLRVRDVPGYGDLVNRGLDDMRASAGTRVEVDEAKEDPLDFALWKAAKPDEPSWPSPWGPGRPGWHIECVAMSLGILGDDFDIHGGGSDLVFPHHTNERAEALAVGRPFARHWVHNAMLNIEGAKMSKSLGNYRTVVEMLDEHPLNGRAFRLLVLQTHYRKTMEVNPELMAAARTAVQRLDALARRLAAARAGGEAAGPALVDDRTPEPALVEDVEPSLKPVPDLSGPRGATERGSIVVGDGDLEDWRSAVEGAAEGFGASAVSDRLQRRFRAAMDHDLGTPEAVAVIFDTLRRANAELDAGSVDGAVFADKVIEWAEALGLVREGVDQASDGDAAIEGLVARRQAAREAKDWPAADALRDELAVLGVVVEDTPAGPIWRRA